MLMPFSAFRAGTLGLMITTDASTVVSRATANRADIDELSARIYAYQRGQEDEDRFKHYRLTRGVYGQRQVGVHMFRTKIPFGHLTPNQLIALADISEKYTNGRLHITTPAKRTTPLR